MSEPIINVCGCSDCQQEGATAQRELHRLMNLFLSRLDERQRRWYAGLESHRLGTGGTQRVAQITGISEKTIRRGKQELLASLVGQPVGRVRRVGGGRRRASDQQR